MEGVIRRVFPTTAVIEASKWKTLLCLDFEKVGRSSVFNR